MVHFFSLAKLRGYEGSLSPSQDTSKEEPSGFCIKLLLVLLMLGRFISVSCIGGRWQFFAVSRWMSDESGYMTCQVVILERHTRRRRSVTQLPYSDKISTSHLIFIVCVMSRAVHYKCCSDKVATMGKWNQDSAYIKRFAL